VWTAAGACGGCVGGVASSLPRERHNLRDRASVLIPPSSEGEGSCSCRAAARCIDRGVRWSCRQRDAFVTTGSGLPSLRHSDRGASAPGAGWEGPWSNLRGSAFAWRMAVANGKNGGGRVGGEATEIRGSLALSRRVGSADAGNLKWLGAAQAHSVARSEGASRVVRRVHLGGGGGLVQGSTLGRCPKRRFSAI
jgi:hypothetical protein